jgi:hypothetical protein
VKGTADPARLALARPLRVAFDVGGVLSKYPDAFRRLLSALHAGGAEVYVLSDMHPREAILDMLARNGLGWIDSERVVSADYQIYGEECKAVSCEHFAVDILVDDFVGYVACQGRPPVRLLCMPDPERDYYAAEWKTDGSEGAFGRRRRPVPGGDR